MWGIHWKGGDNIGRPSAGNKAASVASKRAVTRATDCRIVRTPRSRGRFARERIIRHAGPPPQPRASCLSHTLLADSDARAEYRRCREK